MFCPNCGTKNDDSAVKCSQCGFDQRQSGTPKFKGTMMLEAPPRASPGAPAPAAKSPSQARANLKGTMVGVAPPDLELLRKQAAEAMAKKAEARKPSAASTAVTAAPPGKARVDMKGTMVGVAPPAIAALRKEADAAVKGSPEPQRSVQARPTAAKSPLSHLKGTMIGVAPPNMQAELEKAKQTILEQRAMKQAPSPATPSLDPSRGSDRPSNLKGTMMGVASPEMQAELTQARKDFETNQDQEARSRATAASQKKDEPPSEPDPFKGTVIGTSPFATPPSVQGSQPAPGDFSEDTPAALSSQREAARISSAGGRLSDVPAVAHGFAVTAARTAQMPARGDDDSPNAMETAEMLAMGDLPPVVGRKPARAFSPDDESEEKSTSLGKVVLIASLVIVAIAAIVFMTRSGGGDDPVPPPAEAPPVDGAKTNDATAK